MGKAAYKHDRPNLTIERTGGQSLGSCYSASHFRITSSRRLTLAQIRLLEQAGLLGSGQEFLFWSRCNGEEAPAFTEECPCIDEDTGEPAKDYRGKLHKPYVQPYYVYDVERRTDSSG